MNCRNWYTFRKELKETLLEVLDGAERRWLCVWREISEETINIEKKDQRMYGKEHKEFRQVVWRRVYRK